MYYIANILPALNSYVNEYIIKIYDIQYPLGYLAIFCVGYIYYYYTHIAKVITFILIFNYNLYMLFYSQLLLFIL